MESCEAVDRRLSLRRVGDRSHELEFSLELLDRSDVSPVEFDAADVDRRGGETKVRLERGPKLWLRLSSGRAMPHSRACILSSWS